MSKPEVISIDEVKYIRADSVEQKSLGNRAVVVVDRGWIFAGDVTRKDGRIFLNRAVWVFRWESIGFDAVIKDPKNPKVTLKKMSNPVEVPQGSEIFSIPVESNWGL